MSYESLKMEVPAKPEYVGIIRLTVSGIANKIGFNLDDIEDIKVAVSEACTNAIKHSYDDKFNIEFEVLHNGIVVNIQDKGKGCDIESIGEPDLENPRESGLGLFIIKTLMDELEIKSEGNKGTNVRMIKYIGDDI